MTKFYFAVLFLFATATTFSQNPLFLKDVNPGAIGSGIQQIVKTSNYTFFNAEDDDADADRGLYRTDGTPGGTIKLNLTYPTYLSTKAEKLTALADKIIFAGDNFPNYGEVWASDGTQGGTIALERFQPTITGLKPVMDMVALGNEVLYGVVNNSNRSLLKKTDGTAVGTSVVYDFSSIDRAVDLALFRTINNILYFNLYDLNGTGVDQLWRSDGTTAGTYMVKDFGLDRYAASYYMPAGNLFYFMIVTPGTGNVLWKSDGTTAGTTELKTIGTTGNNNYPQHIAVGTTLYFSGLDANGMELWKTDGNPAGTVMVADINSGSAGSLPNTFTLLNNNLYFSATTATSGNELWKFDGVNASIVKDIYPGIANSSPGSLVVSNNTILFRAATATGGAELWITDGSMANTQQVADIYPGATGSIPNFLTSGNPVYFSANNGINGAEIFKYDNSGGTTGLHKIYVNDNSMAGDVFTTAVGNNANAGTRTAPVATITYALSIATAGDSIMVDAGTFTEQITIDKAITIVGAGANLTSILKPAVTSAPPGTFTEQGVIQTTQNISDVHIRDLSVTGDFTVNVTPIILQTGGSVKNCKLQNGNQGIFFRVESATKTAVVENNIISAEYIGVNFAGPALTASLTNNSIQANNQGFSAGIFAGADFGGLIQFTATGNSISNYTFAGFFVNSLNAGITQNSIVGVNGPAIQQIGGNAINASCNWFGTDDAELIKTKISGNIDYTPWLTNGTDNNVAIGFQPVSGTCNGRQNKFYVNDNSRAGDLFTTAVGNNANNGFSSAPFAKINYAISVAQAGDTIVVDAGMYPENITVNKSLTLRGAKTGNCPGALLTRGDETIITPPTTNVSSGSLITITAPDVKLDGLTLDGDNPTLTSSYNMNGADVDGFSGITNNTATAVNMHVVNCIIKNFNRNGIGMFNNVSGLNISCNHIDNLARLVGTQGIFADGRAINMFGNNYGTITNNYFTRVSTGIIISSATTSTASLPVLANNTISSYTNGMLFQLFSGTATPYEVTGNTITKADYAAWNVTGQTNPTTNVNEGIRHSSMNFNNSWNFINNNISGCNRGIWVIDVTSTTGALNFMNNNISGSNNGMDLSQVIATADIKISGGSISGSNQSGIIYNASATNNSKLNLDGVSLANNNIAIDASYVSGNALPLQFNNTIISGGAIGLRLYGNVSVPGGVLSGINFSGQSTDYIQLTSYALQGQVIDASTLSFDGLTPMNMTLAQLFATEDKLSHKIDFDSVGYFKLKPREVFVTKNSFAATLPLIFGTPTFTPDINRAIGAAAIGDTIHVGEGDYTLPNITLDKALTFLGPNSQLSPNNPANKLQLNAARNAEAIINGSTINILSSNLSFEGFTFDPGNKSAFVLSNSSGTNNDFGNFIFSKNILKITNTTNSINQFSITGKLVTSPALPVTSGFSFTDNRFEKSSSATGTTLNFNYVKNVLADNNSFVVSGATVKTQQIANVGNTGIVSAFGFANNTIDGTSIVVNSNRLFDAVVSGNRIINSDRGINVVSSMPESSSIEFSNNILETTTGGGGFIGYNRSGTSLPGTSNIFKVENNIFTGVAVPNLPLQLFGSMNFTVNNSVLNHSFIIRGNKISYSGDFSLIASEFIRPITVRGNVANLTLDNNELLLNNTGILLPVPAASNLPINPGITINTDFGNAAYMPSNAIINIGNNKVQGFKQSLVFYDATSTGINVYGGYGNIPTGATVNISNNSFTGDSISINNGTVGQIVSAACNWYGLTASQNVSPKITETTVDYSPWLTNGTDNDVATGFQPLASICNGVPVDADVVTVTNVSCNSAANGAIDVLIEEGLAPFSYAWSKDDVAGFSTSEDISNLAPGNYKLIVTDTNGSADTVWATITEPDIIAATATGTNNICHGGTIGSADLSITGGTLAYTYLWSNGAITESVSGLAAGNYTVTITDANGCTTTASYEVTEPALLTASIAGSSSPCFNSATVSAAGGTGAYSYLWSNGATTTSITSVPAGTYSVTVTDANGCTAVANVTLTANEAFNPSAQVTNITCYGLANGTITVTNVNAVAPFQFSIDGGLNFQSNNVFNGLAANTYTITVKDANGCTGFVTKTVTEPPLLTATLVTVQSTCYGLSTGSISASVAGGTSGYSYQWTGPGYTSSQKNISNLAAGTYVLTITDNNGCTAQVNAVVSSFDNIFVAATVTNIACKGEVNGSINLTVTGGTGSGFSYSWSNGAVIKDIANLGMANYTVTITDIGSGCVVSRTFSITQPAKAINLSATKTNVAGCGSSLGTITATGLGGTGTYQYKLENGTYQSSGLFNNLYAGSYTVWVKDANGCTISAVVSITDNGTDQYESNNSKNQAKIITLSSPVNARLAISTDIADWFKFTTPTGSGSYTVTLYHPSVNYTFNVYATGNNTPALVPATSATGIKTYILAGAATYYISITGVPLSYNCYELLVGPTPAPGIITFTANKGSQSIEAVELDVLPLEATVYPNPHNGNFNLLINSPVNGNAVIELFNGNGQKIITKHIAVDAGANTVLFSGRNESLLLYKVIVGNNAVSGKIIGLK